MKPGHFVISLVLLLLAVAVVPAQSAAVEDGVVMGVILPMSGTHAAYGRMQKNSMLLAVEEVNARGGIAGDPLVLDIRDSGGQPKSARAIIDHFVKDKQYPVVLGGFSSRVAEALADKCEQRRIPLIVVTGSKDAITLQEHSYVFRISPPRTRYPAAAFGYVKSGFERPSVTLITERSSYGDSMEILVKQEARGSSWDIASEGKFEPGSRNFESILSAVSAVDPEIVFLAAFPPDGSRIIKGVREDLPKAEIINLVPSSTSTGSYTQCGVSCEGVMNPALWWPDSSRSGERFREKYISRFDLEPDYHGVQAYAAVLVAAQAIRRSGAAEPDPVRDALEGISISTPYGKVTFRDWGGYGQQNDPANYLVRWAGSGFEVVWPRN